tara:strand:+ start:589 stop:789 length:201 start_codon:yes stop_codon:yes gene_type:complete
MRVIDELIIKVDEIRSELDDLKSSTRYEFDCDERKICTLLSDVSELQSQVGDIEGQIEELEDKNCA